jgi:uncharacterized protein YbgA (DUF1722 family)/uncharacterized protein YbbK (DUF523 family)
MGTLHPDKFPIRVGLSTCLMGQKVRYDGGHKQDRYITDILGDYFDFVLVCPELEIGMGAPRMVGSRSGEDWTERMNVYSVKRVEKLAKQRLSGYILKKGSPSCGMERVKVTNEKGMPHKIGVGLYARALRERFPLLPVEEEGRLHDVKLRENFIVRVFACHRLQNLFHGGFSRGRIVEFHAAHKLLLMAHSPKHYKTLGQLVAAVKQHNPEEFQAQYSALFMEALAVKATARKNVNVLQHIMGFLKQHLDSAEKQDILAVIEDYRNQLVPLVVPLTLVKHYLQKHDLPYVNDQIFLNPHPKELMLRNHV